MKEYDRIYSDMSQDSLYQYYESKYQNEQQGIPETPYEDIYFREFDKVNPALQNLQKQHNSIKGSVEVYIIASRDFSIIDGVYKVLDNIPKHATKADHFFSSFQEFSKDIDDYNARKFP